MDQTLDTITNSLSGEGCIIYDPVFIVDGFYHLKVSKNQSTRLLSHGKPVSSFNPGWRPTFFYSWFEPVFVLHFESESGDSADWFLDHKYNRVGGSLDEIQHDLRSIIVLKSRWLVEEVLNTILGSAFNKISEDAEGFALLSPETRVKIFTECFNAGHGKIISSILSDLPMILHGLQRANGQSFNIGREHLEKIFSISLQDRIIRATIDGLLKFPSLVTGEDLRVSGFFCLDDFRYVYRVVDRTHHTFYSLAT